MLILLGATAAVLVACSGRLLRHQAPEPVPPDPFEALRVQLRLHALADEITRLHHDESIFARAARLEASALAYDDLLGRACRLAGVPEGQSPAGRVAGRDLRARRELMLAERGWSW